MLEGVYSYGHVKALTERLVGDALSLLDAPIQAGTLSPKNLAAGLTRGNQLRDAFLALASDDSEYVSLSQKFTRLAEARKRVRGKGSDAAKAKVQRAGLELLAEVLEPLGVFFARQKVGKKVVIDYDTLVVPATWDLPQMAVNLERQAQRLKALPIDQKEPMLDGKEFEDEKEMSLDVCKPCVFFHEGLCGLGHPTALPGYELEVTTATSCSSFKAMELRLVTQ